MNDSTTAPKKLRITERTVITEAHSGQEERETFFHDALAEDMGVELTVATATDREHPTAYVHAHLDGADSVEVYRLTATGNVAITLRKDRTTVNLYLDAGDVPALLAALAELDA